MMSFAAVPGSLAMKYFAIGIAQKGLGDDAAARTALLKAKDILEEQVKQKPDDADLHVQLAKLLAWLGEKDAAIAEAQRAMDLRPESKDAFEGPQITEQVAQVYAILGDNARAIELLDGLLSRPSEVTLQTLKVNPAWDPTSERSGVSGALRQIRGESLGPIPRAFRAKSRNPGAKPRDRFTGCRDFARHDREICMGRSPSSRDHRLGAGRVENPLSRIGTWPRRN